MNAAEGRAELAKGGLDYVRFGQGPALVMIPGLSDGLRTVQGLARPLALSYRRLAREFTVYLFSRVAPSRPQSTREMAAELAQALTQLQVGPCCVLGVSLGGMIAQFLAADHPALVRRLVLAVTQARPNPTSQAVLSHWRELAERNDYRELMLDTARLSYTPRRARLYAAAYRLPLRPGRPDSFDRFRHQLQAGLTHDAAALLPAVSCPTLILGGEQDRIVTAAAALELAELLPDSRLHIYPDLGHGLYEEAPDFQKRLRDFFSDRIR